ncbi:hypothetical protein TRSC58_04686 [Trypanosoma rangeli SC58]|uniref:Mitochondrial pyruvate carrier n=1 Tax=Trypanosoma rangeli SC58 TaxID=429131 RepID=A0A061J2X4_TRYRA|nr:hypothetical protein TRSC58_04686 [Trypanosoma rangeli SC58]
MVSVTFVRYLGYTGAAANWLIPIAGIMNFPSRKASEIDPVMTSILCLYSVVFLRWALAVTPINYPLFFCHLTNTTVQGATFVRYAITGRNSLSN